MLGIIVLIVMDRTVLQRIEQADGARPFAFRATGRSLLRRSLSGNDELAELEKTIITSRKDLLMREQQLRVFVNAMPGPAALFSREGTILLANPAFAEYLDTAVRKRSPVLISGTCIPKEDIGKYDRFVREAIRKKEVVHFENETNGKNLPYVLLPGA